MAARLHLAEYIQELLLGIPGKDQITGVVSMGINFSKDDHPARPSRRLPHPGRDHARQGTFHPQGRDLRADRGQDVAAHIQSLWPDSCPGYHAVSAVFVVTAVQEAVRLAKADEGNTACL